MKTIITILSLSSILLIISCDRKKSPQSTTNNAVTVKPIDNYLVNTSYLTKISLDVNENLVKEVWNPTIRLSKETYNYGTYIKFTDSLHYRKYYTAPCGNDCFFSTDGKYRLTSKDTLIMVMDSTQFSGECRDRQTVYGNGSEQIYHITINPTDSTLQVVFLNESAKESIERQY